VKNSRVEDRTTRVKICGITNAADARCAIDCGADSLGFNLFPASKRYLDLTAAATWLQRLPEEATKVAIMVDPGWSLALRVAQLPFIDCLQLHGSESPDFCRKLAEHGIQFIKALPVRDEFSLRGLPEFFTPTVLLDSVAGGDFGGTGRTFAWSWASEFIKRNPALRVILAGGLTPANVRAAIHEVSPYGVDVTTGVEAAPGRKDPERLRAFIDAVRSASAVRGE